MLLIGRRQRKGRVAGVGRRGGAEGEGEEVVRRRRGTLSELPDVCSGLFAELVMSWGMGVVM